MNNGILPLTVETLSRLEMKHPDKRDASEHVLLNGPTREAHPIVFDAISLRKKTLVYRKDFSMSFLHKRNIREVTETVRKRNLIYVGYNIQH